MQTICPTADARDPGSVLSQRTEPALAAFHEQLRATGAYETRAPRPAPCRRFSARWRFHFGMQRIIFSGSRLARRGLFDRSAWAAQGFSAQQLVERLGGRVSYEGFASACGVSGPVVCAANHMSILETFMLPSALLAFGNVCVVLKRSLTRYPVFGRTVLATEPIAVSRSNPRADLKQVLAEGVEQLRQGRSVLLFPQATRTRDFDAGQFNSMAVKLAQRANVPVVPFAVATDFASPGRWIRDFGPVYPTRPVRFAAASPVGPGLRPRDWQGRVFKSIAERLDDWGYRVRWENQEET